MAFSFLCLSPVSETPPLAPPLGLRHTPVQTLGKRKDQKPATPHSPNLGHDPRIDVIEKPPAQRYDAQILSYA